ncbi:1-deoxy-D-xylulose-5-phosphate synthase N-terminal domain-containing protein [Bdellovibrio bacteriovorus]|uniref:1-deoxy-D-xylulose-5-phosphate synthase N-terminal domain-containing protein n=1 Tax=Bdellovibrio bacteriovorus TaxID=959 RepID=UPI000A7D9BE1|nr:1-deoxy-D-xylulose-5-phosphate synthase N-terminal domain-containing protein [Bdellovibrio bacteriovorus]
MTTSLSAIRSELTQKLLQYHTERNLGHLGSCLSSLDILTALFWGPLKQDDHFILSKGHAASLLYLILNQKGLMTDAELAGSCRDGSIFGAHPPSTVPTPHPWWGFASGSLGCGVGLGSGVALAKKIRGEQSQVYVLISEGDLNEGSTWEALHFAAQNQLSNLHVLFDHNKTQALGSISNIYSLHHLEVSLDSMGWDMSRQNGHDVQSIHFSKASGPKPHFYIFDTRKNFGFEDRLTPVEAHYKNPPVVKP